MPLYILCAYFRRPKKQQPQTQNSPESNYGSTITVWQAEEKPFIMPNNTHSGRSRNWQENSLTVAVGLGQWEERRGIITQLTHVRRASPVLGAFGLSGSILPITDSEMTAVLELDICSLNLSGVKTSLVRLAFCFCAVLQWICFYNISWWQPARDERFLQSTQKVLIMSQRHFFLKAPQK